MSVGVSIGLHTVTYTCLCLDSDVMKLKTLKGLALQDIITQVHMYIQRGGWCQPFCSQGFYL